MSTTTTRERLYPSHASLPLEQLERLTCEQLDHRWAEERRGEPVTAFLFCLRCRKIGERLP